MWRQRDGEPALDTGALVGLWDEASALQRNYRLPCSQIRSPESASPQQTCSGDEDLPLAPLLANLRGAFERSDNTNFIQQHNPYVQEHIQQHDIETRRAFREPITTTQIVKPPILQGKWDRRRRCRTCSEQSADGSCTGRTKDIHTQLYKGLQIK